MRDEFLRDGFRKVTGPIEYWVTTYHTDYWGFRPDKEAAWRDIEEGEIFLFHASASQFLDVAPSDVSEAGRGIIGLGRVGAKSIKDDPAWWEELHNADADYPYLIHFFELYWFGDTELIRDVPVREKSIEEMVQDVHALSEHKISFGEMDERAGYRIPAQGSPGNVKHPEKLYPLLVERIHGDTPPEPNAEQDSQVTIDDVRDRTRERGFDVDEGSTATVEYETSVGQTMEGWLEHEHALDTFEDDLVDAGFESGETEHSDILARRDDVVVLVEAKSIHEENERTQIRKAIGQLYEYGYFDVKRHHERAQRELIRCLVLTREPSDAYRPFLTDLQSDGIFTFWTDEFDVRGLEKSMDWLNTIVR